MSIQEPVVELRVSFRIATQCRAVCCGDGAWQIIVWEGTSTFRSARYCLACSSAVRILAQDVFSFFPSSLVCFPSRKESRPTFAWGHHAMCVLVHFKFWTSRPFSWHLIDGKLSLCTSYRLRGNWGIVLLMIWYDMWYDIFNCNWVATRWQLFSTHIHTNNTGNVTKETIHRTTQKNT